MKLFFLLNIITVLLVSCNVSPQHIEYGTDACHYCNMTIVDRQHAAQLVTTKGKVFKYDAIECMVHSLQDNKNDAEIALYLVADFNQPGQLMDATMASYLVSEQISSPMGANLSAFENEKSAENAKQKFTGEVFSWEKIQKHLKQ
ncbi:MAG: hypothetical protein COA40_06565 [Aequorivita sp.]|nr:MAG: hypothetical protein COA40_06565 [Aequorivita sp.]